MFVLFIYLFVFLLCLYVNHFHWRLIWIVNLEGAKLHIYKCIWRGKKERIKKNNELATFQIELLMLPKVSLCKIKLQVQVGIYQLPFSLIWFLPLVIAKLIQPYKNPKSITENKNVPMQLWCLFYLEICTSYQKCITLKINKVNENRYENKQESIWHNISSP